MPTAYAPPTIESAPLHQRIMNVLADGRPRSIMQIQTSANAPSHGATVNAMEVLADLGSIVVRYDGSERLWMKAAP